MKDIQAKTVFLFVCVTVLAVCANASLYNDQAVMGVGTVSGGGLSGMGTLTTPIPEPATILMIGPGLLMLINRKRHSAASKTGRQKIMITK